MTGNLCYNSYVYKLGEVKSVNAMTNIVANDALKARLVGDIVNSKLAHAYIIEGGAGTGRRLLAKDIAAAMACERKNDSLPCFACENCRKIMSEISPDVYYVGKTPGKASIGVDSVRDAIIANLPTVPNDLDYKFFIIEDADDMTVQAQNALLLTLEEPPEYVVIFLICERAESLLETVRSRAPVIRTEKIPPDVMESYLLSSEKSDAAKNLKVFSPDEFQELILAADGSIGAALDLLDEEKRKPVLENRNVAKNLVDALVGESGKAAVFTASSKLNQKSREVTLIQLELVKSALRDLILLKKSDGATLCFYYDRRYAVELSDKKSLPALVKLYDKIEDMISSLNKNINAKLTLSTLLFE